MENLSGFEGSQAGGALGPRGGDTPGRAGSRSADAARALRRIEYKLLSLLQPGETFRFILHRGEDGLDMRFAIAMQAEGADGAPSSDLTRRVDIVLHALRNQGLAYALDGASPPDQGDKLTWFAIRPEIREMLVKDGQLGFVSGSPATSISPDILIPALGALQPPDLVGYATEFVEREPGVEQIRLSFTRRTLDSSWDGQLVKAMNMGFGELMSVIRDDSLGSAAMLRFLTLWVVRRTGWKIDVTAGIRPGHEPARAALELLGREVYDTDCSIEPAASLSSAPSAPERLDLVTCYPDGWVFPPFLPPPDMIDRMNLERLHNPSLPSLPRDGLLVGFADGAEVRLPLASRDRHTYIVGATGTGKSTLLTRMIRHDIEAGEAVVLLDPHGDLYADVLAGIPTERKGDVVTLDPNRDEDPIGFNLLDVARDALFDRRVDFVISEFIEFFWNAWPETPHAFGPMFEVYFRNAIMLLMCQEGPSPALLVFDRVFTDRAFRRSLCETCTNPSVIAFWKENAEKVGGEASLANVTPYITCKVSPIIQSGFLAQVLGAPRDLLQLDRRLDERGIILVNLNKGMLGARCSRLLGSMLTMQLFAAGLKRSLRRRDRRPPVNVYIDEFQNFVSDNIAEMFSEARKFGLRLHVANQHLGQLQDRSSSRVLDAILGNVGNMILFRLGVPDSGRLEEFSDPFTARQMQELPNYHALTRLLTPEGPIRPFVMKTLPVEA